MWDRLRGRRALVITGLSVLAVAGGGAAAWAATAGPVDSAGVIYGCYTTATLTGSHGLVLQDTGKTCPKGTTAIQWNQQGQPGPQGSPGPQGPAGPGTGSAEIGFTLAGGACTLVRSNAESTLTVSAGGFNEGTTTGCVFGGIPAGSVVTASAAVTDSGAFVAVPLRVEDFTGDGTTWFVGFPNNEVSSAVIDVIISSPQTGS
jgi:hypothetical protein